MSLSLVSENFTLCIVYTDLNHVSVNHHADVAMYVFISTLAHILKQHSCNCMSANTFISFTRSPNTSTKTARNLDSLIAKQVVKLQSTSISLIQSYYSFLSPNTTCNTNCISFRDGIVVSFPCIQLGWFLRVQYMHLSSSRKLSCDFIEQHRISSDYTVWTH